MDPYRSSEDRLGRAAREADAIEAFGAWRMAVRGRFLMVAAVAGAAAGVLGFLLVTKIQLAVMDVAWLVVSVVAGLGAPFVLALCLGGRLAARHTRRHLDAKIAALAERYDVDREALGELARAAASL